MTVMEGAKQLLFTVALLVGQNDGIAQPSRVAVPTFMGHKITIVEPKLDADGFFPEGPASVCVEGLPQRQCYTAPKDFGGNPTVEVIQIEKGKPVLFFRAASGGVSGFGIHFALLRPGAGNRLDDLFMRDVSVSNQSQYAFWEEGTISPAKIFVTADYAWGPDEGHYSKHRYFISAYLLKSSSLPDEPNYFLEDRYMTTHKYDLDENANNILASELDFIHS